MRVILPCVACAEPVPNRGREKKKARNSAFTA
jgi:hypothetical protein